MIDQASLESGLAKAVPVDVRIRVYHVSTTPTPSPPILASPPGQEDQTTSCESHFLTIASDSDRPVFVYAIEVLIFTTDSLTTIFVSKADTSGFLSKLKLPKSGPSFAKSVTDAFLSYLLAPRLRSRIVLSLFARSQSQYLFPGSSENAEKHILDDRQLIKWWCRVLDAVWRPLDECHNVAAHVLVPGCERSEMRAFFPASSKLDSVARWHNSYPANFIAGADTLPPRCLVPRLPDDPKSRFLDDLDGDYIGPKGQWRSVKSLSHFWEMMVYRQECHAGRLVGFIWVTLENGSSIQDAPNGPESPGLPTPACSFAPHSNLVPAQETRSEFRAPESPRFSSQTAQSVLDKRVEHPSLVDQSNESVEGVEVTTSKGNSEPSCVHSPTEGDLVTDSERYQVLMDFLLEKDFAGLNLAIESTNDWIEKAREFGAVAGFGKVVTGKKLTAATSQPECDSEKLQITMLTGIRKKRKPENEASIPEPHSKEPLVNTLSSSLIRKKARVD